MSTYEIKYVGGTATKAQHTATYTEALALIALTLNDGQHAFVTNNDGLIAIVDLSDIRPANK